MDDVWVWNLSSDAELLARSLDDPEVFAGLYERHGPAVRRLRAINAVGKVLPAKYGPGRYRNH